MANKKKEEKVFKRTTVLNGHEVELRILKPSKEAIKTLGIRTFRTMTSEIALNPHSKEKTFGMRKVTLLRDLAMMNPYARNKYLSENAPIDFVLDKQARGYKKYSIFCSMCGDKVAYC